MGKSKETLGQHGYQSFMHVSSHLGFLYSILRVSEFWRDFAHPRIVHASVFQQRDRSFYFFLQRNCFEFHFWWKYSKIGLAIQRL